jgi:tetratricopeptide (TPR) repeat protein
MGFAGNLNTLSLVEVFQTISRIRATGVLRLAAADHGRDVVFADGEIIGLRFRAGEERLGLLRRLILEGLLDANAAANISSSKHDSATVLAGLIEKGQLSQADVLDALQRQAEDELYNLCTWQFADFIFHDAIPEEPAIVQEVNDCRQQPLQIKINILLMESARRMDDWDRLRKIITSEDVVLGHSDGREQDLLAASKEYPGAAVVPLIDAVRTVEAVIRESVATRLDVYSVLAGLFKDGLVAVLSRDDIISHGDFQYQQNNFAKAAELFRRALSEDPTDRVTNEKLAHCLEQLGEQPAAAGCFAQLALGLLDEGNGPGAVSSAYRAVRLANDDPQQRMILVRCLLDTGDLPSAIKELRWIAARYLELGQLEDSRGTCLKILELDPKNEDARREMARIFASAERDAESEDVVVCVQCGHVNHREATTCKECEAPLRLSCQSCKRTVAVSDKICIFCGANPHLGGLRKLLVSPATTRIVKKNAELSKSEGKSSAFWQNQFDVLIKKARKLEESSDLTGALEAWREVAKANPDNKELLDHIRDLEAHVSDDQAEKMIEKGHQYRRARRFNAALKSYRAAVRSIPEHDPRHPRLKDILQATAKDQQRILVIYGAAFLIIGIFGWLVARPYLLLSTFRNELSVTRALLLSVPPGTSPASFGTLINMTAALDKLEDKAQRLGNHSTATEAKTSLNEFRGEVITARMALATATEKEIATALENREVGRAGQLLTQLKTPEFQDVIGPRLAPLEAQIADARRQQTDIATRQKQAPEELESTKTLEQTGELARALASYRALASLNHETVSPIAKEGVARLEPGEHTFNTALAQAQSLMNTDVGQVEKLAATLGSEAKKWNKVSAYEQLKKDLATKLQSSALAYQQLGSNPTPDALLSFIRDNPNTSQSVQARARYNQIIQAQRSRDAQVADYRVAMSNQQTEQAWRLARNLFAGGGGTLPEDVRLPIRIESMPAGAQVTIDGKAQGVTPCVVGVLPSQVHMSVQLSLDGWQKFERKVGELAADWRASLSMTRSARWQVALGKSINAVMSVPDGSVLALAGDALHRIAKDGTVIWRTSVAAVDELSDLDRFHLAHLPLMIADGSLLLGYPAKDVAHIDAQGAILRRFPSISAVRGRPQTYTNDLLGGQLRVAYAADRLYIGDLTHEPVAIDLPSPALSGPISVPRGPDRLLAVATVQGQLIAFEESSKQRLWQSDLKATEIGQLVPIGTDSFATVLDGSRIACFQIADGGLRMRWNVTLPGPALGEPVVANNAVWLTAGTDVVRISFDGIATNLNSKIQLITPVSAAGDLMMVGNKVGQVILFKQGKVLWASQCQAQPTSVACTSDGVVVGMADGTLTSYTP